MSRGTTDEPSGRERPNSIKEALRMLDEALAAGGASFNDFVSDEFKNIKSAFTEVSHDASQSFRTATENIQEMGAEALRTVSDFSEKGMGNVVDGGRQAFSYVNSRVRANPWPFIGGVALGGILLGMAIRQSDEKEPETDV